MTEDELVKKIFETQRALNDLIREAFNGYQIETRIETIPFNSVLGGVEFIELRLAKLYRV